MSIENTILNQRKKSQIHQDTTLKLKYKLSLTDERASRGPTHRLAS